MATMKTLNGYGFNATELNGKTSDSYLLKTDTVANSADSQKLGGKAPEYYLNPKNLLDNSDFRNPVNQRGASGAYGVWGGYTIDRWCAADKGATIELTNDGINLFNGISQIISADELSRYRGKAMTFAAMIDGVVYAASGIIEQTGAWHIVSKVDTACGSIKVEIRNDNHLLAIIENSTKAGLVKWAALYEGNYTADTLPPYVPKGYAAELAECQRYFVRLGIDNTYVFIGNGVMREGLKANIGINYNTTMRVLPTITFHGIFMLIPSFQDTTNLSIDSITRMSATIFCTIMTERPIGEACILVTKQNEMSYVDISADL